MLAFLLEPEFPVPVFSSFMIELRSSAVQQFISCHRLQTFTCVEQWCVKVYIKCNTEKKKSRQNTLLVPPLRPKLPQQLVSPELPHCICLEMKPEGMHGDSFNEQLKLNRMFWLMKRTVYKVTSSSVLCVTDNPQMIPKFEKTAIFSFKWTICYI